MACLSLFRELPDPGDPHKDNGRRQQVAQLAQDLEERKLYKRRAFQREISVSREEFCRSFGAPKDRRRIEHAAAAFAKIPPEWVVLWIPPAEMRLKLAEALIDDNAGIKSFVEKEGQQGDGSDLPGAPALWAVSVYIHRDVPDDKVRRALVSISADLDTPMPANQWRFEPTEYWALPPQPHDWRERVAVETLRGDDSSTPAYDELAARRRQRAARGDQTDQIDAREVTLSDLVEEFKASLDEGQRTAKAWRRSDRTSQVNSPLPRAAADIRSGPLPGRCGLRSPMVSTRLSAFVHCRWIAGRRPSDGPSPPPECNGAAEAPVALAETSSETS